MKSTSLQLKSLIPRSSRLSEILSTIQQRKLTGIFWVILSMLFFSITMSISKFLGTDISTPVKVFMRLLFGVIILFPFMGESVNLLKIRKPKLQVLRTLLICGSMLCTYYAYTHLPFATATAIGFTTPLITTTLSIFFLKEKVTLLYYTSIMMGYIGVLIMVRPTHSFPLTTALIGLLANVLSSCAIILANQISKADSVKQTLFFTTLLSLVIMAVPVFYFWKAPTYQELFILCLLGVTGVLSQYCYLKAISYEKVSVLAPFEYVRLVFSVSMGFLIFSEIPKFYTFLGSIIIISINFFLARMNFNQKN